MIADGVEDEEKWLSAGIAGLQQNAFHMHRALDSNNLKDALKFSSQMLSELRTSRLSPHKYYELYMRAFDELRKLEIFFKEETGRGCSIVELYELVQHAGNILPRLYLLCTVGCVYIKSKEAPAKDILKDLVEMCRGIQHPLRGLFLRSYLSQVSRDKLPDIGSEYEGDADTVMDAVEFVLQNFTEMNELWVRMQHQGPTREKEKREKERSALRDLVGKNLHVLSQIEGVDLEIYKEIVLPRVLEQDELAQYYLMDCIIQVFPDEYHLQTLETLLNVCPQLQPSVDVKTVLARLMERLSNYAASGVEQPGFIRRNRTTAAAAALSVGSLVRRNRSAAAAWLRNRRSGKWRQARRRRRSESTRLLSFLPTLREAAAAVRFLLTSREAAAVRFLTSRLLSFLPTLREAATIHVGSLIPPHAQGGGGPIPPDQAPHAQGGGGGPIPPQPQGGGSGHVAKLAFLRVVACIYTAEKVDALFELIKGLVKESDEDLRDELDEDFKEEKNSVARLIQMLQSDDPEEMLKLVRQLEDKNEGVSGDEASATPKKIFQLVTLTIDTLSSIPVPELALGLYLQCAEAANNFDLEPVAYEFFTQAYILYEEEITDSKAQVTSLHLIIGTLQRMHYSAKLLKKSDQCRAVYACSHMFWLDEHDSIRDGERVLLCLKRALRIANAVQQMANATRGSGSVLLLVEILNKYLYFYEKGVPKISVESDPEPD
ncbi:Vacuolar protein sorting-associated protein 35A [Striga hermonthica]|uniref:Vacuolar protein sorting-associated protein 35 n=1 Tax=Striga hermonthica TaxID=68872 RepID=A0A9N7NQB4_STRHE|nr:Vacuolar protein sorting-associated protein 35A [Striga hermonthica]